MEFHNLVAKTLFATKRARPVHPNMRGHSGGGLSLGRGFPIVSSTKQKLNMRSSTETEIVGADDFMPATCWTWYFIEAQGYQVQDKLFILRQQKRYSSGEEWKGFKAAIVQNISIFGISSLATESKRVMCH